MESGTPTGAHHSGPHVGALGAAPRRYEAAGVIFAADYPFMDVFWTMVIFFLWTIWICILVSVLLNVFRRPDISGWRKAAWTVFVIVLPYLGVFVYLISQGGHMAEQAGAGMRADKARYDRDYRSTAPAGASADQIGKAKQLLDSGAIDHAEFEQLKRRALA